MYEWLVVVSADYKHRITMHSTSEEYLLRFSWSLWGQATAGVATHLIATLCLFRIILLCNAT